MFRSALVKLMAWYIALAMALSLVFSVAVYHLASRELNEGLHNQYRALVHNSDHDKDIDDPISSAELHSRNRNLLIDLVYLNISVLVLAAIVSYFLAKRTLEPIEEAHRAQIRFTAEASHELRTPITAMKADTESVLMSKKTDANSLRKALEGNLNDIERLDKIANHLLDMSRYRSKTVKHSENMDLRKILNQAEDEMIRKYIEKEIKLTIKAAHIDFKGDPAAIERLFSIVLDNAFKYSSSKGTVKIALKKDNGRAIATVEDKGMGISRDDLPHIFEHFYRSKHTNGKAASGFGLGLPLAKDIADMHGGEITVTSRSGKGTKVVISLPI